MKIKINGKIIENYTALKMSRSLDSIASTFAFSVRFNPENDDHKELFKPLQYYDCLIYSDNDDLMMTGTILNHQFDSDSGSNLASISGYSKSGILEDVTIPPSLYPLESINRSLRDIVDRLCSYYGISVVYALGDNGTIDDDFVKNFKTKIKPYREPKRKRSSETSESTERVYKKTTAEPTETVKSYVSKLTSQRNLLLSHDNKGNVVIFKVNTKQKPKYFFNKETLLKASSSWNGQAMHSEINVVRQPSMENAGVSTVDKVKSFYINKNRPLTKVLSSGEDTDTKKAAENEYANELKNITLKIELQGLYYDIKPGDLLNLHLHEVYSFAYSRWMVSTIDFEINENSTSTSINLLLPESFTGEVEQNALFYYESHKRHT